MYILIFFFSVVLYFMNSQWVFVQYFIRHILWMSEKPFILFKIQFFWFKNGNRTEWETETSYLFFYLIWCFTSKSFQSGFIVLVQRNDWSFSDMRFNNHSAQNNKKQKNLQKIITVSLHAHKHIYIHTDALMDVHWKKL